MRNTLVETLTGAVVLAVAGFFLFFAYTTTGMTTGSGYTLVARFNRAEGINVGTDVRISGIKVGSVEKVELDPRTFEAITTLRVDTRYEIPDDSVAKIAMSGLLGDNFVAIDPGGSEGLLKEGQDFLQTTGSVDLMGLISEAIFSTKKDDKKE
ncbi:MAG: outer membrane lipid asymmetry maintenance protein MlaD [Alphaproteobacteria bacterium]|nr:outer membrane lipid asymmetry maintenance protein MlaD [Alphaproteobacteria bacterium]